MSKSTPALDHYFASWLKAWKYGKKRKKETKNSGTREDRRKEKDKRKKKIKNQMILKDDHSSLCFMKQNSCGKRECVVALN